MDTTGTVAWTCMLFRMSRANTTTGADNQHFEATALKVEGSRIGVHEVT